VRPLASPCGVLPEAAESSSSWVLLQQGEIHDANKTPVCSSAVQVKVRSHIESFSSRRLLQKYRTSSENDLDGCLFFVCRGGPKYTVHLHWHLVGW
jgi:hypothetical protein